MQNYSDTEDSFKSLVDHSLIGLLKTNIKGDVIYANDSIIRMLGFESADAFRMHGILACYKYPTQREELIAALKRQGYVDGFEAVMLSRLTCHPQFLRMLQVMKEPV